MGMRTPCTTGLKACKYFSVCRVRYSPLIRMCSKLGFDRNDRSTIHKDKLPSITEKGMCLQYAVTHEDFAWGIRGEPGVVDAFEKVYDTKDLIVSFDAVNFGFPK